MAAETITVYIDSSQLAAQKNNNYSLYLAKMVNGEFTVIWQSFGAVASVTNPAVYEYQNTFNIQVPSYEVNYGTVTTNEGSVTFSASGLAVGIDIGQTVELDENGLFGTPSNTGTAGEITIDNALAGNPNGILLDDEGNPIFVNTQSGMDIGTATFTPIDTYQIWFDNYQDNGTIIAQNVSNVATVTFSGGTTNQVISYNASGQWQTGPLSETMDFGGDEAGYVGNPPLNVAVVAAFSLALTTGAVTYLLSKLIDKFPTGLRPKKITAKSGSKELTVEFEGEKNREIVAVLGVDKFVAATNTALIKAKQDKSSNLQGESWTLTEPSLTVLY